MGRRPISVTVECLVEKDGKWLMLRRHADKRILPNVWIGPGGHREFCEGLFQCARREIKEETGLDIRDIRIRATGIAHLRDIDQEFSFHILTAKYAGGELMGQSSDGEFAWLTLEEIGSLEDLFSELKYLMPRLAAHDSEVLSVRAVYSKGNELVEFEIEDPR
jgi:8-oxo-dGTP diphosphatase